MSMFSAIDAEHDLRIVNNAIRKVRKTLIPKLASSELKTAVNDALKIIREYCNDHMGE